MIDIKRIKQNKDEIEKSLSKKMGICSLNEIIELDNKRIELQQILDQMKQFKNENAKKIAKLKTNNENTIQLVEQMKEYKIKIERISSDLSNVENLLNKQLSSLPNIPDLR